MTWQTKAALFVIILGISCTSETVWVLLIAVALVEVVSWICKLFLLQFYDLCLLKYWPFLVWAFLVGDCREVHYQSLLFVRIQLWSPELFVNRINLRILIVLLCKLPSLVLVLLEGPLDWWNWLKNLSRRQETNFVSNMISVTNLNDFNRRADDWELVSNSWKFLFENLLAAVNSLKCSWNMFIGNWNRNSRVSQRNLWEWERVLQVLKLSSLRFERERFGCENFLEISNWIISLIEKTFGNEILWFQRQILDLVDDDRYTQFITGNAAGLPDLLMSKILFAGTYCSLKLHTT